MRHVPERRRGRKWLGLQIFNACNRIGTHPLGDNIGNRNIGGHPKLQLKETVLNVHDNQTLELFAKRSNRIESRIGDENIERKEYCTGRVSKFPFDIFDCTSSFFV